MFIKEYKNSLLQDHICKRCGRAWNEYGEEIYDTYIIDKVREYSGTITVICPMCEFEMRREK